MSKLKQWQGKIDELSLRERGALLFCVLFAVYFVWDMFFMQPLQIRGKQANTQLQQKQAEQAALNTQVQVMVVDARTDPDKAGREKLRSLRSQLKEIESQVQDSTQQLISPRNMAVMLENVLRKVKGLELLEVQGLGSEPVIKLTQSVTVAGSPEEHAAIEIKPVGVIDNAYKHGLRIKFRGDYMSTLAYIQELENMEWGFFWESLKFEVNEYPKSTATITVFTLSLDENWIGV